MYKNISWDKKFVNKVLIKDLYIEDSWKDIINKLLNDERIKNIEYMLNNYKDKINIYPYPDYLFHAFNLIPIDKVNIIIIGQDAYHNIYNNIPQAMGLAFSVQPTIPLPSSLKNIFNNMKHFGHIKDIPSNGDLTYLAKQGCLLINSALTVFENKANSHKQLWQWFTDYIIEYISNNYKDLIFVLWGAYAYKKIKYINTDIHKVIISSHPSGLSYKKRLNNFPSFSENDHFGQINEYLEQFNKPKINYNII